MSLEQTNYRNILKHTLVENDRLKGGHSLRAFSERVGVSNSFLSEVLRGRKSLSVELAFKIAVKVGYTDIETQRFCLLVQLDNEKDAAFRAELSDRLNSLQPDRQKHDLSADIFRLISDWHHFAILELNHLAGFQPDPKYISSKLGISKTEAEIAIDRLIRLDLLEKTKSGSLNKIHDVVTSTSAVPVEAFKQFHTQLLEKAVASLSAQMPSERVSATDLIALDSRQIAKVDKLSIEFANEVIKLSKNSKIKDHVYALSVQCFRITNRG